ncbi:hypothetical protein [Brumimicrobium aurantiacum]|uniref:Uncharacterized protein n=1 Tax=Brumimicrobium aurantiacum TaxID=1737063 RepID=A0A3E1F1T5_9FLAO|nr:hypothetical protein [Brumimicrobium aurantiacum]RFC55770.1 hypothetical protein DXU93_02205 [Brumimicrobium aurantiacum]
MKEEYETLLSNYDGALLYQEESRFNVFGMTYDGFMSKFVLKIPYKDHEIEVENEYGKANVGEVRMKLCDCKWVAFNIQTRNHLKRLFSFNKASFIVQSSQYKRYFSKNYYVLRECKKLKRTIFLNHIYH